MRRIAFALLATVIATPASAASFVNVLAIPNGTDLSGKVGVAQNRLGGFGSDLIYDATRNLYYGITDRGPGGGFLSYAPRMQTFSLATDVNTGAISGFNLVATTVFKRPDGTEFNGLNPQFLNGNKAVLGNSFDSEGLAMLPNGNFLVSDEYGPSVYEFSPNGTFVRAFNTPANLLPKEANGTPNYVDGRNPLAFGRQDNRGFEGLTLSPDGKTAYAILQDPLVNEGRNPGNGNADGRYSRNVRMVAFDVATGEATGQFIYQLDDLAAINDRTNDDFAANAQGRSIGVSSIVALGNGKFLVLERDNRGVGVDPTTQLDVASKRIYLIDITGATDVSNISLAATNTLPAGVKAVTKESMPMIDLLADLKARGLRVPEKVEGVAFGEWLADGGRTLLLITDNDFSVTQLTDPPYTQFDVCVDNTTNATTNTPLGSGCTGNTALVPTYIYSYKLSKNEYQALLGVPEPASWMMMIGGFGAIGATLRRRRRHVNAAV